MPSPAHETKISEIADLARSLGLHVRPRTRKLSKNGSRIPDAILLVDEADTEREERWIVLEVGDLPQEKLGAFAHTTLVWVPKNNIQPCGLWIKGQPYPVLSIAEALHTAVAILNGCPRQVPESVLRRVEQYEAVASVHDLRHTVVQRLRDLLNLLAGARQAAQTCLDALEHSQWNDVMSELREVARHDRATFRHSWAPTRAHLRDCDGFAAINAIAYWWQEYACNWGEDLGSAWDAIHEAITKVFPALFPSPEELTDAERQLDWVALPRLWTSARPPAPPAPAPPMASGSLGHVADGGAA